MFVEFGDRFLSCQNKQGSHVESFLDVLLLFSGLHGVCWRLSERPQW